MYIYIITIWLFNIAMENPWSMEGFNGKIIYEWTIFHGYVKLPEGISCIATIQKKDRKATSRSRNASDDRKVGSPHHCLWHCWELNFGRLGDLGWAPLACWNRWRLFVEDGIYLGISPNQYLGIYEDVDIGYLVIFSDIFYIVMHRWQCNSTGDWWDIYYIEPMDFYWRLPYRLIKHGLLEKTSILVDTLW